MFFKIKVTGFLKKGENCMKIFITNATGFVGAYLTSSLLNEGNDLFVLARAKNKSTANARVEKALKLASKDFGKKKGNLFVHEGDVTFSDLGFSSKDLRSLKKQGIKELWHSAGSVDFSKRNKENTIAVNFGGMKNTLKFALKVGVSEIHYISTAYSDGNMNVVRYDDCLEELPRFNNPYEKSKYLSEQFLLKWSCKHPEIKVFIYKPSIIVGDSVNGRAFNFSGYYRCAQVFHHIRKKFNSEYSLITGNGIDYDEVLDLPITVPGVFEAEINIITIDYALDIIMSLRDTGLSGVYLIVNENPPVYGELLNKSMQFFNITGVKTKTLGDDKKSEKELKRIELMIYRGMYDYLSYVSQTFQWNIESTRKCLGSAYRTQPDIDIPMLNRILEYAVKQDFNISI